MPGTFDGRVAYASIRFPAPGAPAFRMQSGDFASVAVVGSVTRLTFQDPIAPYQGFPSLTLRSATGGYVSIVDWTSTYLDIETLDTTGAAAEIDFDLTIVAQTVAFVVPPPPPPPPPGPPTANLIGWWKADGILGLSNGDPVALWTDESGTGNNLTSNGGIGAFPSYVASDPLLNNLPAVQFNGNAWLFPGAPPIGMPVGNCAVTVYTVAYYTSAIYKTIWNWGTLDPAGNPGHSVGITSHPTVPHGVLLDCNGTAVSMQPNPVGAPFVGAWAHDAGTNVQARPFYVNGATGPTLLPVGDGPLDMTPAGNWTIRFGYFSSLYPGGHFEGSIAEVLVYNDAHSPATITQVTAYLKNKWGIP